jgi:hypothetical protein
MDATAFFARQQLQRFASLASSAALRVRTARTLREVRDWGHISMPGYLRVEARHLPEYRRLSSACEQRAKELVEANLKELEAVAKSELPPAERVKALKQAYGSLVQNHWVFLRGEHPSILSNATRQAQSLIGKLDAESKQSA